MTPLPALCLVAALSACISLASRDVRYTAPTPKLAPPGSLELDLFPSETFLSSEKLWVTVRFKNMKVGSKIRVTIYDTNNVCNDPNFLPTKIYDSTSAASTGPTGDVTFDTGFMYPGSFLVKAETDDGTILATDLVAYALDEPPVFSGDFGDSRSAEFFESMVRDRVT